MLKQLLKLTVPFALMGCMTEPTEAPKQTKVVVNLASACKDGTHLKIHPQGAWFAYITYRGINQPVEIPLDKEGFQLPCQWVKASEPEIALTVFY